MRARSATKESSPRFKTPWLSCTIHEINGRLTQKKETLVGVIPKLVVFDHKQFSLSYFEEVLWSAEGY